MIREMLSSIRHLGRHRAMGVRFVCRGEETVYGAKGLAQDLYELVKLGAWRLEVGANCGGIACPRTAVFEVLSNTPTALARVMGGVERSGLLLSFGGRPTGYDSTRISAPMVSP